MDREVWHMPQVHGVAEIWTQLSELTLSFHKTPSIDEEMLLELHHLRTGCGVEIRIRKMLPKAREILE